MDRYFLTAPALVLVLVLAAIAHADDTTIPYDATPVKVAPRDTGLSPVFILDRPDAWIQFGRDGDGELAVALPLDVFRFSLGETFRRFDHDTAVAQIDFTLAVPGPATFAQWWARAAFALTVDFDTGVLGGDTSLRAGWQGTLPLLNAAWWFEAGKITNGAFWFGVGARAAFGEAEGFRVVADVSMLDLEGAGGNARATLRVEGRVQQWALFAQASLLGGVDYPAERVFGLTSSMATGWLLGVEFRA